MAMLGSGLDMSMGKNINLSRVQHSGWPGNAKTSRGK